MKSNKRGALQVKSVACSDKFYRSSVSDSVKTGVGVDSPLIAIGRRPNAFSRDVSTSCSLPEDKYT